LGIAGGGDGCLLGKKRWRQKAKEKERRLGHLPRAAPPARPPPFPWLPKYACCCCEVWVDRCGGAEFECDVMREGQAGRQSASTSMFVLRTWFGPHSGA